MRGATSSKVCVTILKRLSPSDFLDWLEQELERADWTKCWFIWNKAVERRVRWERDNANKCLRKSGERGGCDLRMWEDEKYGKQLPQCDPICFSYSHPLTIYHYWFTISVLHTLNSCSFLGTLFFLFPFIQVECSRRVFMIHSHCTSAPTSRLHII